MALVELGGILISGWGADVNGWGEVLLLVAAAVALVAFVSSCWRWYRNPRTGTAAAQALAHSGLVLVTVTSVLTFVIPVFSIWVGAIIVWIGTLLMLSCFWYQSRRAGSQPYST